MMTLLLAIAAGLAGALLAVSVLRAPDLEVLVSEDTSVWTSSSGKCLSFPVSIALDNHGILVGIGDECPEGAKVQSLARDDVDLEGVEAFDQAYLRYCYHRARRALAVPWFRPVRVRLRIHSDGSWGRRFQSSVKRLPWVKTADLVDVHGLELPDDGSREPDDG